MDKEILIITSDLGKCCASELDEAIELLEKLKRVRSDEVEDDLTLMFNTYSGCVFLGNEEGHSYMVNSESGELEEWLSLPYSGYEGFYTDLIEEDDLCSEDKEYLTEYADNHGLEVITK